MEKSFIIGRGFDDWENIKKQMSSSDLRRFYLKRGETANVIFLDDLPSFIREHKIWVEDDFGNARVKYFTCCRDIEGRCPICEAGNRAYIIGYLTIIDERTIKDRNGNEIKMGKKLFGAKQGVVDILKNKRLLYGGFAKRRAVIFRSDSQNSPTSGDDINILDSVQIDESPYDYQNELKPKPYDELLKEFKLLKLSTKLRVESVPEITSEDGIDF